MKTKSSRARLGRRVLTLALITILSSFILASARLAVRTAVAAAATFTVNSAGDTADSNTADNFCDDGAGNCTLRAAIQQANATAGADTIAFNIAGSGVHTIQPATPLPPITEAVTIDGYTQPGAGANTLAVGDDAVLLIELRGSGPDSVSNALTITSSGSTVQGLVINGFAVGVRMDGGGNTVRGCFIGTDAAGATTLPNNVAGVLAFGTGTVGGTTPAARNVISGNGSTPNPGRGNVVLRRAASGPNGVTVQGNYIGTNAAGTGALDNPSHGVRVESPDNLIGGTASGAGNVISGNSAAGISLDGFFGSIPVTNNIIKGNLIGLTAAGAAPLPNFGSGVANFFASGTQVGGPEAGAPNQIAHNGGPGVLVGSGTGVRVSRNSIHTNVQLGINLGGDGATVNDTGGGDADTGANNLQNFPVLGAVDSGPASTSIQGTLDSNPNAAYTLEFFSNETCDLSAFGEGQTFLGDVVVVTDGSGDAAFNVSFPSDTTGRFITATATDAAGNTSEFSVCNQDGNAGRLRMDRPFYTVNENNGIARVVVLRTHGTSGEVTVSLTANTGTATPGIDYEDVTQTLTFADGEALKVIDIPIFDDFTDEPNEIVNLVLRDPTGGATLDPPQNALLSILDNDTAFNLSINDVAVSEPLAGTALATFTVTLSAPSSNSIGFGYNTSDGTATAGADYQTASGTETFAPGETTKRVSVTINSDLLSETDETFFVTLNSFLTHARGVGRGTIVSDNTTIFEFDSASYLVNETDHRVTVTVNRLVNASGEATVDYATADGTASERRDYTTALGRLRFAPGETSKSFDVLITEDAYEEPDETIHLTLSNPSGGGLTGNNGAADITILANDTPPPAGNPIDDSQNFVRQHYHDFLNREPDAGGIIFWTNEIEQCGADAQCRQVRRANVSAAFFLSIEFQQTGYRTIRFYRASFPSTPQRPRALPRYREFLRDTQELQRGVIVGQGNWQQQLNDNLLAFAREWVQRPDFLAEFPLSMEAEEYINKLFANSGVTPTPTEFNIAFDAYNNGGVEGRARALIAVIDSNSVYNKQYNPALVLMQYIGYLRRNPDDPPDTGFGGYDFWLSKLDSFSQPGEDVSDPSVAFSRIQRAEMVRAFIESIEYRRRFAP